MTTHRFDVYAAGLVDGEGCITAKSTKSGTGMGIRVLVGMATKAQEVLARLHATYGGTLITQEPKNPQHAKITTWTLNGGEAARFLVRISPHLILKADQARIAMEIESIRTSQERIGSRDHYRWTPENLTQAQALKGRLMLLNARGREASEPTGPVPFARLVDGTWVTNQADLFSEAGWELYTETWPRSGCMRDGQAFELPMLVPPTIGSESSSSSRLPTPKASDGNRGACPSESRRKSPNLEATLTSMAHLPTPTASDGDKERDNPAQANRKSPPLSAVSQHFR